MFHISCGGLQNAHIKILHIQTGESQVRIPAIEQ
jgi:hypothetical protein